MTEPFVYDHSRHGNVKGHLPKPVDHTHHLSQLAIHRTPSAIKGLYKYMLVVLSFLDILNPKYTVGAGALGL